MSKRFHLTNLLVPDLFYYSHGNNMSPCYDPAEMLLENYEKYENLNQFP